MSEMRTIENERLLVEVSDHGAELSRIYDKSKKKEVLWNADPRFWGRHACILFPIVGALKDNQYTFDGKTYEMKQHGFARNSEFICCEQGADHVTHKLSWSEETYKVYPFKFILYVTHRLAENSLTVEWKVVNEQERELYFSIGAHPAFNIEEGDKLVLLPESQEMKCVRINAPGLVIPGSEEKMNLDHGVKTIDKDMFKDGVYIFENGQVEGVGLQKSDNTPYVMIQCKGFPFTGIWAAPGAPFVCLEPWYGRTDADDFTGMLQERVGGNVLNGGETFQKAYQIIIN